MQSLFNSSMQNNFGGLCLLYLHHWLKENHLDSDDLCGKSQHSKTQSYHSPLAVFHHPLDYNHALQEYTASPKGEWFACLLNKLLYTLTENSGLEGYCNWAYSLLACVLVVSLPATVVWGPALKTVTKLTASPVLLRYVDEIHCATSWCDQAIRGPIEFCLCFWRRPIMSFFLWGQSEKDMYNTYMLRKCSIKMFPTSTCYIYIWNDICHDNLCSTSPTLSWCSTECYAAPSTVNPEVL